LELASQILPPCNALFDATLVEPDVLEQALPTLDRRLDPRAETAPRVSAPIAISRAGRE